MEATCSVGGCEQSAVARGWCPKHWSRWRNHGTPEWQTVHDLSLEDRFWAKVERSDGCWLWTAALRGDGYGAFQIGRQQIGAHRFSYELHHGEIPEGMCVMHSCDAPRCVNPEHLLLGTHAENQADAARKGRKRPGSQNMQAKLTEDQVLEIRGRYAAGDITHQQLATDYSVSLSLIGHIISRRAWRHI